MNEAQKALVIKEILEEFGQLKRLNENLEKINKILEKLIGGIA